VRVGADTRAYGCAQNEERTPLHNAATQGHAAVIALLLDEGIDVNVMNYVRPCAATSMMRFVQLSALACSACRMSGRRCTAPPPPSSWSA
jgi:ankyrin repeat protein